MTFARKGETRGDLLFGYKVFDFAGGSKILLLRTLFVNGPLRDRESKSGSSIHLLEEGI